MKIIITDELSEEDISVRLSTIRPRRKLITHGKRGKSSH